MNFIMVLFTTDSGQMTAKDKVKEFKYGLMVVNSAATGKMTRHLVWGD